MEKECHRLNEPLKILTIVKIQPKRRKNQEENPARKRTKTGKNESKMADKDDKALGREEESQELP